MFIAGEGYILFASYCYKKYLANRKLAISHSKGQSKSFGLVVV